MKRFRSFPLLLVLLLCWSMAVGLLRHERETASRLIGQKVDFSVPVFDNPDAQFSPASWKGNVVMLHVFASWCQYCLTEHPAIMKLATAKKIKIMGLAWKDNPEKLAAWLKKNGNPYRQVGFDAGGQSTVALGLSGVPETYIFDKKGVIAYNRKSLLNDIELRNVVLPLIEKLQHE